MMSSTLALAAATVLGFANVPAQPTWQPDYRTAVSKSSADHKPIAVFVGAGAKGYEQLVSTGTLPTDAADVLVKSYVCVYVDTTTAAGRDLATTFGLTEGLIISDKSGSKQALKHAGKVPAEVLAAQLVKFADPAREAVSTEYAGAAAAPVVVAPAPVTYAPVTYAPVMSGCANGRCGTPVVVSGGCANGRCYR